MSNAKMIAEFSAADRALIATFLTAVQAPIDNLATELANEREHHARTAREVSSLLDRVADQQRTIHRLTGQIGLLRTQLNRLAKPPPEPTDARARSPAPQSPKTPTTHPHPPKQQEGTPGPKT